MTVLRAFVFAVSALALVALGAPQADAQSRRSVEAPAKSGATRGKVRGFERRIGGYSYRYNDATIDYRDNTIFDDPLVERTGNGIFNGGFWFDSTSGAPSRDESPYP